MLTSNIRLDNSIRLQLYNDLHCHEGGVAQAPVLDVLREKPDLYGTEGSDIFDQCRNLVYRWRTYSVADRLPLKSFETVATCTGAFC